MAHPKLRAPFTSPNGGGRTALQTTTGIDLNTVVLQELPDRRVVVDSMRSHSCPPGNRMTEAGSCIPVIADPFVPELVARRARLFPTRMPGPPLPVARVMSPG